MTDLSAAIPGATAAQPTHFAPNLLDRLARRAMESRLAALRSGQITIEFGGEVGAFGGANDDAPALRAQVRVHDARFFRRALLGGSLGAAEAWLDGWWTCDDLVALLRIFVRDLSAADGMDRGWARWRGAVSRIAHALRRNHRAGSRRNIREHYDLGNEFFALWLDESMTYSCAWFDSPNAPLRDAQTAKLDRLCRKLDLQPTDHLLEIGSGWGCMALHAAGHYGCRVTTTTISPKQHELAVRRVAQAGLADRVSVIQRDYRDLDGRYDKIASIEMIEAVGHEFLPTYFAQCAKLLKPDGVMALQAITMPDHRYGAYRRSADFIQRYVFPGSCCPSLAAISAAVARASDLRIAHVEDIGLHYVLTLQRWREAFISRLDDVRGLGISDRFIRLWMYYLAYCEAGFAERYISDAQIVLARPGHRATLEIGA